MKRVHNTRFERVATFEELASLGRDGCLERGLLPPIGGGAPGILPQTGAYPLLGVGSLPNADVAYPGEVWSYKRANGVIVPGSLVRPVMVGSVECVQPVVAGDVIVESGDGIRQQELAVALRQIMTPDINPGSQYNPALGPNEIVNLPIADQDYVRTYHTGVMNLTLVVPDATYAPGDIIGWDPTGVRPAGKAAGNGAWAKHSDDANVVAGSDIFVVHTLPRYYGTSNECVLTCRFLRSNV
jgi:hypothetical protein